MILKSSPITPVPRKIVQTLTGDLITSISAVEAARCCQRFEAYRQRQLEKGRSKIAANVALSRKLVRIAFTLMNTNQMFQEDPKMA